ncbi:hypothetical protein [Dehalobacter sp. TBBPA1]|uniref:hypothetical protein n=1 Tax=Dehalobacter sp. TBBPA1 TaxID=3235037 RepID=UPI0034A138CA
MSTESHHNTYQLLVTITTFIFAVTSMITVYISLTAWKEERESVRPYLTFTQSPSVEILHKKDLTFSFHFTNVGTHPAASLHCQAIFADSDLNAEPLQVDQISLANYVSPDSTVDLVVTVDIQTQGIDTGQVNQHYIILNLKYFDPVFEKQYEQIIYLRWAGISKGQLQPIYHASREDKAQIIQYLGKT